MTAWKVTLLATQWLLLSTQSVPLDVKWEQGVLPPKEFDHEYDGELKIQHMIAEDIDELCRGAVRDGQRALACTRAFYGNPKSCTIYMMTEDDLARLGWNYNIVLRHELGHCNGWHHAIK